MKDRIKLIMESQHLTQQSFAQVIGLSTPTISNILNGKTRASLTVIEAIKNKFPQINTEWLLFGVGSMYNNNKVSESDESTVAGIVGEQEPQQPTLPFGEESAIGGESGPSDQASFYGQHVAPKNIAQTEIKYIDKHQRKITEIRIFYDDQTWETFVPKK